MLNRGKAAIVGVGVLVFVAAVWALSAIGPDDQEHHPATPVISAAAKKAERQLVHRGLRELHQSQGTRLEPLALTQGKPESMPLSMQVAVTQTIGPAHYFDLKLDEAQYAKTPLEIGVWLVEGRGVTCMFRDKTGTSSCATTIETRRRGAVLAFYRTSSKLDHRPSSFTLLGIAPNSVEAVSLRAGRKSRTIRVQNHLFAMRSNKPVRVSGLIR